MTRLGIKLCRPGAAIPTRATGGSAGYDLAACSGVPIVVPAGKSVQIPTGVAIELPDACYVGLVYSRSGHGHKHGVRLANSVGVIDSDYRGEIVVALQNSGENDYVVAPGERIAQLVIAPVLTPELVVKSELAATERGENGIGSTGLYDLPKTTVGEEI